MRIMLPSLFTESIESHYVLCEPTCGDSIDIAIQDAKKIAIIYDKNVFFIYGKVPIIVSKSSNIEEIKKLYFSTNSRYERERDALQKEQAELNVLKTRFKTLTKFPFNQYTFAQWFYDFSTFAKDVFIELKFLKEIANFISLEYMDAGNIALKNAINVILSDFECTVAHEKECVVLYRDLFNKCANICEHFLKLGVKNGNS